MSVFFQVLAALIVFTWLLGWAYDRALKQAREQEWRREERLRDLEQQRQKEHDLQEWRKFREVAIGIEDGTYPGAKLGCHLRPGDEISNKQYDNSSKTTDTQFMTIIAPTGEVREDYPGHIKYVRMKVHDDISWQHSERWIDTDEQYTMVKYRQDDIAREAPLRTLSKDDRLCKDGEDEVKYRQIEAKREARAKRRALEIRAEYDAWIAARPTMRNTQEYVRALARDWHFPDPHDLLPPADLSHCSFVSTVESRAINDKERARFEACLAIERRKAGLEGVPWP